VGPILAVLYLGAFSTGLGYVLLFGLIRDIGAMRASSVNYLLPIVAVILGAVVLGEPLRWTMIAGGLMVLAGVALTRERLQAGSLLEGDDDPR
jgi:drug/metabolite transporter (DMT)-like permease